MNRNRNGCAERRNEELNDILEDLLTRIQEIRDEFTAALDDVEDMIMEA